MDPATLPPLPQIEVDKFLPGVRTQLNAAFDAVRAAPVDAEANGHLAMLLQTYKQFNSADIVYRRVRALQPDEFRWAYLHATVLRALGEPDRAIAAFEAALALRGDYPFALLQLAELLDDRGDTAGAEALYARIMNGRSRPSEAWFSYGKFLLRHGNVDKAIASFEETLRLTPGLGVAHYQLGLAFREKGERAQAEQQFRLARRHEGYSGDSGDPILNQLLPLNMSEQPFVHRAKVLAENGRLDEAREFIRMALERNPDSAAAHASMIGLAASDGDFAAVDRHFARAIEIDPDSAKVYFNLGMARIAEARWVEAARAFETSLRLDDTDPNVYVQLAILDERAGRTRAAERRLRDALGLEPEHQLGSWLLGELLTGDGRGAEAVPLLQQAAASEHPMLPLILVALAQAQAQTGAWADASATLARATEVAGQKGNRNMLARVREVERDIEAARAAATDDDAAR